MNIIGAIYILYPFDFSAHTISQLARQLINAFAFTISFPKEISTHFIYMLDYTLGYSQCLHVMQQDMADNTALTSVTLPPYDKKFEVHPSIFVLIASSIGW